MAVWSLVVVAACAHGRAAESPAPAAAAPTEASLANTAWEVVDLPFEQVVLDDRGRYTVFHDGHGELAGTWRMEESTLVLLGDDGELRVSAEERAAWAP